MNRVWLCILLFVSLAGSQWLPAPARGENDNPCPPMDTPYDGQNACPYLEEMRAYGECPWYHDHEYHYGATADVIESATGNESGDPAVTEAEAADEATAAAEAPATSEAAGPPDCWYDGATDSYYDYEFTNADMIREETAETTEEAVESYAVEETDAATEEDWSGSYEFPSETAASQPDDEEVYWVEDLPEANPDTESMSCDESYEYAYPGEGTEYPYGGASETEMAGEQSTETMEASEEVMEGIWEADTADLEANESPSVCPSGDYDYDYDYDYQYEYSVYPDRYDDGEIILSLARTLDRVGVTLQSLSRYLTEMATSDLAKRHSETLER